ncbi:MAG: thioredoxin domain-containing protein [Nitrospirota bacterium]
MALDLELERVTDQNYPDFLAAPAALILFKIANCEKCEEFLPIVADTMQRYDGRIRWGVALLHVPGACREIKRKHRFETFPTTHFYKAGQLVHQEDHKLNAVELDAVIQKHLLGDEPPKEPSKLEKVNRVIRIILAVVTVGILLVALIAIRTRGTGY